MSSPPFPVRGFNLVESVLRHDEAQLRRFIRRMKTLNFNSLIAHYDYGWERHGQLILEECAAAGVEVTLMVFGPRTFLNWPEFTPRWLAKDSTGAPLTPGLECESKPCRFELEAVEAYERGARRWLQSLPAQIRFAHVRCGDGIRFCECAKCAPLPEADRWQPFVDTFVRAWQDTRPELACEVDVYVRRYEVPGQPQALHQLDRLMYDTFYRHPFIPIGTPSPNTEAMSYATSLPHPDSASPNEYHARRLQEWSGQFPGKVYIHENLMMQSYLGVFQHNVGAQLQDLETYRKLGLQGVIYEAYEPGYSSFAAGIEVLAEAMVKPESASEYRPSELEQELRHGKWDMPMFCTNPEFPVENFVPDEVLARHIRLSCRFRGDVTPSHLRAMVHHGLEHREQLDYLYIGFLGCKLAKLAGLSFQGASEEAQRMLSFHKLWDYMETIPASADVRKVTAEALTSAVEACH